MLTNEILYVYTWLHYSPQLPIYKGVTDVPTLIRIVMTKGICLQHLVEMFLVYLQLKTLNEVWVPNLFRCDNQLLRNSQQVSVASSWQKARKYDDRCCASGGTASVARSKVATVTLQSHATWRNWAMNNCGNITSHVNIPTLAIKDDARRCRITLDLKTLTRKRN